MRAARKRRTGRMVPLVVSLAAAPACSQLLDESFRGYHEREEMDGGTSEGPHRGVLEDPDDAATADGSAGMTPRNEVIHLGKGGGCPGSARLSYSFEDSTELWTTSTLDRMGGPIPLSHTSDVGSLGAGALRLFIPYDGGEQSGDVRLDQVDSPSVSCFSARIYVPRSSVSRELSGERSLFWLLFFVSGDCWAGSGNVSGVTDYRAELMRTDVWYEVALNLASFGPNSDKNPCTPDPDNIDTIGLRVGALAGSKGLIQGPIYIDDVRLF